jgi:hypothetical protein
VSVSWLETRQTQIKPRSWRRYEEIARLHLVPTLGKLVLSMLTPQDVQRLYSQKLAAGLSSTTVRHLHVTLRAVPAEAERQVLWLATWPDWSHRLVLGRKKCACWIANRCVGCSPPCRGTGLKLSTSWPSTQVRG